MFPLRRSVGLCDEAPPSEVGDKFVSLGCVDTRIVNVVYHEKKHLQFCRRAVEHFVGGLAAFGKQAIVSIDIGRQFGTFIDKLVALGVHYAKSIRFKTSREDGDLAKRAIPHVCRHFGLHLVDGVFVACPLGLKRGRAHGHRPRGGSGVITAVQAAMSTDVQLEEMRKLCDACGFVKTSESPIHVLWRWGKSYELLYSKTYTRQFTFIDKTRQPEGQRDVTLEDMRDMRDEGLFNSPAS